MAHVHFSSGLRRFTDGVVEVTVEASTVRQMISALDDRFPGIGDHLRSGVSVAIDGEVVADALYEPLPEDAEVHFLETIRGG